MARYDVILDETDRVHLYNHLRNCTNINYSVMIMGYVYLISFFFLAVESCKELHDANM